MLGDVVLFVHVLAGIVLLGPSGALPFLGRVRGSPPSAAVLRWADIMERQVALFFGLQLVTGVALIFLRHYNRDFDGVRWLHVSLVLFFAAAAIAVGYNRPRVHRARRLAEAGRDEEAERTLRPVEKVTGAVLGVLITAIVWLMVTRPG
jgi:uncharacterized membrane protein